MAEDPLEESSDRAAPRWFRPGYLFWAAALALLWWVLRGIELPALRHSLSQLQIQELLFLIFLNILVALSFSGRWWVILRAQRIIVPFLSLSGYRLAAFGVSYVTPGPRFGGEPLQIYLLYKRRQVPITTATASVALDKALELLVNFTFLFLGVLVVVQLADPPKQIGWLLILLAFTVLLLPLLYLLSAWRGAKPVTWLLLRLPASLKARSGFDPLLASVADTENQVTEFCREHPGGLIQAVLFSILSWVLLLFEYHLLLQFLGLQTDLASSVAVVTAARLAILLPFPAAIGALESSQILILTALGYAPSQGAALALMIRARDVLFASFGLALGWRYVGDLLTLPGFQRRSTGEEA